MNKNDVQLIIVLLIFSLISIVFIKTNKKNGDTFKIYYENDVILEEKLNKDNIYEVEGYNGKVKVEVKNNKIRVIEETSPLHICQKQGFISKPSETLICLPNKIIIKIESTDLDGVIR